jgi:hypothetical protein
LASSASSNLVFFDEIAITSFDDAEASISVLKDYMQTGKFSRGDQEFTAPCSVFLGGNIDTMKSLGGDGEPDPNCPLLAGKLTAEVEPHCAASFVVCLLWHRA